MKEWFWSNCVIEALRAKFKDWDSIRLIPLWQGWHFHMLWYDKANDRIWHFTDRELGEGKSSALLYSGQVLHVEKDALMRWAKSQGVKVNLD